VGRCYVSAKIIELAAFRAKPVEEDEPCGIVTAIDVAIRDLSEIIKYWGSEGAKAHAIECERMLKRVFKDAVSPPAC
jgi:hypothetical protein